MKKNIYISLICILVAACAKTDDKAIQNESLTQAQTEISSKEEQVTKTAEPSTEVISTETTSPEEPSTEAPTSEAPTSEALDGYEIADNLTYSEVIKLEADYDTFYGFDEVDMFAQILVLGEFLGVPKQHVETVYNSEFGKDIYLTGNTKCQFRVDKVLLGELSEGDILEIDMAYSIYDDQLISATGLAPVRTGDKRMLSLNSWEEGIYFIYGGYTGTFPWPTDDEIKAVVANKTDNLNLTAERFGILELKSYQKDAYIGLIKKYFHTAE